MFTGVLTLELLETQAFFFENNNDFRNLGNCKKRNRKKGELKQLAVDFFVGGDK